MSDFKLVDADELDAGLTSIANAIRAKTGEQTQLSFPSGMVSSINSISGAAEEKAVEYYSLTYSCYTSYSGSSGSVSSVSTSLRRNDFTKSSPVTLDLATYNKKYKIRVLSDSYYRVGVRYWRQSTSSGTSGSGSSSYNGTMYYYYGYARLKLTKEDATTQYVSVTNSWQDIDYDDVTKIELESASTSSSRSTSSQAASLTGMYPMRSMVIYNSGSNSGSTGYTSGALIIELMEI